MLFGHILVLLIILMMSKCQFLCIIPDENKQIERNHCHFSSIKYLLKRS